jgi:4-hydroxy-tetrahydrodipicolinate synthase
MNFSGTYTALITPYTQYNTIDFAALEKIIEEQIEAGIDGLVMVGTTGESPTLNWDEHNSIVEFAIKQAKGRCKIIAGSGSNYTLEALAASREAEYEGADALLVVTPYYNKPTQKGIFKYFDEICKSVKIPVIAYNIKGRCGVNIETSTLKKIAEKNPNLIGVKEASGSIEQAMEVRKELGEDFVILSGDDALTVEMAEKAGGNGVISVLSNIMPKETKSLTDLALKGNFEEAKKLNEKLSKKMDVCFIETNPIPIKTLMAESRRCQEIFRSPMCEMEEENKQVLLREFADVL